MNQLLRENKISDLKETFRAVIKAILDIRMRLPPIFKIDPKFILVDTATTEVLVILSEDMFKTEAQRPQQYNMDTLRYISPEELSS